jgi:hypothetical protein
MESSLTNLIKEDISEMEWMVKDLEGMLRSTETSFATHYKPGILKIQEGLVDIQRTLIDRGR